MRNKNKNLSKFIHFFVSEAWFFHLDSSAEADTTFEVGETPSKNGQVPFPFNDRSGFNKKQSF
jgi:hypothetical protein